MQKIKSYILGLSLFLIPIFFLPITHEFYNINKFMLLTFTSIILLTISSYQFLKHKKFHWSRDSLRLLILMIVFLAFAFLSTSIASVNKVQALLNFTFSPVVLVVLTIYFWYFSHEENDSIVKIMIGLSGIYLATITIILYLNPLGTIALPKTFQFLKSPNFSPIGSRIDLILFMGFTSIYQLINFFKTKQQTRKISWFSLIGFVLSLIALLISFLTLKPGSLSQNSAPINLSLATVSKNFGTPTGFLIGAGVDNFSSLFTQVKDNNYNASSNWSVKSFDNASSAILQVLIETGIFGFLALIALFVNGFLISGKKPLTILLGFIALAFLTIPASLILFLLFHCTLGLIAIDSNKNKSQTLNFTDNKSLFLMGFISTSSLVTIILLFIFALLPSYRAEMAMRNSVDAIANNDLGELYNNQYEAVILNPYIERYRVNFSQTNLFVAKQMAARSKPDQAVITSSVQQAINEAQAAISLNPKKAGNWENLGVIYKNVLGVKGAEQWAIAALQRAILLDPQNVSYRLELGGVYYSLKQYENAIKTFQEATLLKPDLPISYYNLAYSFYQNQNTDKAVMVMDVLLNLLKKQSSSNYQNVLKEREDFASGKAVFQAQTVIQ